MKQASATECASAPWLSNAALGKPVVPDVNSTMPGASGSSESGENAISARGKVNFAKSASPSRNGADGEPTTMRGHAGRVPPAMMISSRAASRMASLHCAVPMARTISSATPRLLTSAATPPIAVIASTLTIHSVRFPITTATLVPCVTPKRSRSAAASAAALAKASS